MTTQITDHVNQALARLHEQHKDKANIEALLTACVAPVQDIEDALWQLFTERLLSTAVGVQLDVFGNIVNQPRNGLSDADYRRYLSARIATSKSRGLVSDIIIVSRSIINDLTVAIDVDQVGIAGVEEVLTGTPMTDAVASDLISFLRDVVAAGVRILLHYTTVSGTADFYIGTVGLVDGAHSTGSLYLELQSPGGVTFPDSGTIIIDQDGVSGTPETISYVSNNSGLLRLSTTLANDHFDGDEVILLASDIGIALGVVGSLNGVHTAPDSTITATTTAAFPSSGSITLSPDLPEEETVTYSSKTSTVFTLDAPIANNHSDGAEIYGPGGLLARVIE